MRIRHSLQKNCNRFRRQQEMRTQTPNAAGSRASPFRSEHAYPPPSASAIDVDSRNSSASTWHRSLICTESPLVGEEQSMERGIRSYTSEEAAARDSYLPAPTPPHQRNIPEQLAELLMTMIGAKERNGLTGEELAESFRDGPDAPPVTKQSLGELDIQNIITNIKLRHDVNFDRDLSFRPNVDGVKGQEKTRATERYRRALVAELQLYVLLSQETRPLRGVEHMKREEITRHAERRLPTFFHTIRDVLKSLVPDRDHSRVDEHLDVSMLMQEIERGVCDMVRLAEWMAHLLKEHCAPMRDQWVDAMVISTRKGVTENSLEKIVQGLCELLGILEAMKLDVANHQIRNLKTLLIEDTINFERHYHLDKLVHGRARVNMNIAQNWYADANDEFGSQCTPRRDAAGFQLEVFTRAVVAILFGKDGRSDFPETFYLDDDRLQTLKTEIDDLVFFEVCMSMFAILAKQFGYGAPLSLSIEQQLRASISAIMGEAVGHGPQQWMMNSEALSLEILRQASRLVGQPLTYHFDCLADANHHLRLLFTESFAHHAAQLEATFLPQILGNIDRHTSASPMDLFNSLVSISPSMPPHPTYPSQPVASETFASAQPHPETAKLTDLANRITHIVLLHWRVWGPIAYVQDDDSQHSSTSPSDEEIARPSVSPQPTLAHRPQPQLPEEAAQVVATMMTGDPLDSGQETHVPHQTSSQ
ncbi:uncharacterized protein K460DRAFT_399906 [Cucurbitaria berberidis CBS 394.84]|uniref:Tcp11-domain-containing protein n=1 Tax=Cucurbitaria berberidis CBS 394.84 TaxID=1168544 RepID=A0A9P4GQD8_9PLEO|nr:uncharacterized protein K460DRAFT_399906 [Cucurbitaria berberidis CBS 394.84]KAF1849795.1 hypothetical protein K460DRAFT_399906 [Cucurbitaria berberidis CBS 394.84]